MSSNDADKHEEETKDGILLDAYEVEQVESSLSSNSRQKEKKRLSVLWSAFVGSLRRFSPTHANEEWMYINAAFCGTTFLFLVCGCLPSHFWAYIGAAVAYVPYNLIVCFLWFIEASLWIMFDRQEALWSKVVEWLASLFWSIDGILWMIEWLAVHESPALVNRWGLIAWSAIDFVVYLYYFMWGLRVQQAQRAALLLEEEYPQGNDDDDEDDHVPASNDVTTNTIQESHAIQAPFELYTGP